MGFYIRKSVSIGPLRFNLSKSGIGVSAGIKGLGSARNERKLRPHGARWDLLPPNVTKQ